METNLTTLFASKDSLWTEISNNIRIITSSVLELKNTISNPHLPFSPALNQPPPQPTDTNTTTPLHTTSQLINASSTIPYSPQHATTQPLNTIVLPPASSVPTFSGKPTERPRHFLLRVEEYTRTVNNWSRDTLLRGISQFLKDDAFEWYCQLCHTNNIPGDWTQFVTRFLAQFHSPIRAAQQEQAWIDCKQQEGETINQLVVRLRSIWLEQRPEEDESQFTKHLFCKMRPDMLNLMNFSLSSSLDIIIKEAQSVEEILYLRNKEQRQRDLTKPKSSFTNSYPITRPYNLKNYTNLKPTNAILLMDLTTCYQPSSAHQQPTNQPASNNRTPITCWRCYETGHYSTECSLNSDYLPSSTFLSPTSANTSSQPLPPSKKNI